MCMCVCVCVCVVSIWKYSLDVLTVNFAVILTFVDLHLSSQ